MQSRLSARQAPANPTKILAPRYGWHRDELCLLEAGPPTWRGARGSAVADTSTGSHRGLDLTREPRGHACVLALATGGAVLVGAMTVREMGGDRRVRLEPGRRKDDPIHTLASGRLWSCRLSRTGLLALGRERSSRASRLGPGRESTWWRGRSCLWPARSPRWTSAIPPEGRGLRGSARASR